jgi:hypothetical protein
MALAPIILFAYNRPEHTRKTLLSLKQNYLANESTLIIYVDGPKVNATEEQLQNIRKVKQVVREQAWCKDIEIIESAVNKGLSASVTEGVTEVLNKHGKVIVLEDDLLSDQWFLKFMNDALTVYENQTDVACITGYIYPVTKELPETFFLKGADCWGWATWKRAWNLLETDGSKLLKELEAKNVTRDFNFDESYPYIQMLRDQIAKKNNSWAILWYASAYLKNKFTLYPGKSLIHNIGVDGSGTHSSTSSNFDVEITHKEVKVELLQVQEHTEAKKIVAEYFKKIYETPEGSFFKKIINKLKSFV